MHHKPTIIRDHLPNKTAIQKTYFLIFNEKLFTPSNLRKKNQYRSNLLWHNCNSIKSSTSTWLVHYNHCERIKKWGRTLMLIWQIKTNWLKWMSTSNCWTLAGLLNKDRKFSWSHQTFKEFPYTTQASWNSQVPI